MNGVELVESFWQDLRYAARSLRKNPAFAAVAIGTFALAIGANTAIFSVIDAALLRPLPYKDSGRLVFLWNGEAQKSSLYSFSYPRFETFRGQSDEFTGVAAYDDEPVSFADRGEPERIEGGRVSKEFFSILGIAPTLGRTFSAEEDRPGGAPVALLSHHWWQERYGRIPVCWAGRCGSTARSTRSSACSRRGSNSWVSQWRFGDAASLTPARSRPPVSNWGQAI